MHVKPIRTALFRPKQSLEPFLVDHLPRLHEKDVVVVTSKIVALAQGRVVPNGAGAKEEWIRRESERVISTPWCALTLKDSHWCPNAGIDESNADGSLILWPRDPFGVARRLRRKLMRHYRIQHLGVLITDSRIFPLRVGVTGVALGYAGFHGLRDYRGTLDLFGRALMMTQTNIADALATAAVLVMGEGEEQTPLAVIRRAPIEFCNKVDPSELRMDPQQDLFAPVFRADK